VAESQNYAYALTKTGLVVNLYGSNELKTSLVDGSTLELKQETDYPWDGTIKLRIAKAPKSPMDIDLRIPGWTNDAVIRINGEEIPVSAEAGSYARLNGTWEKGDIIELNLPMQAQLMEANPLVEEARNQVAVKRGPIVYCIESPDLDGASIFDVAIPTDIQLEPVKDDIAGAQITFLQGEALLHSPKDWNARLYQPIDSKNNLQKINIRLIPYFAWGNRGISEMSVWMPLENSYKFSPFQ
jgi:DUF1680 family protein